MQKIHPYNRFGRLTHLTKQLEALALEQWGVSSIQAPFIPLDDLELGDLGSDFPTRVAAALRRPARELGAEMAQILQSEGIKFLVYEGFLNVRLGFHAGDINPKKLSPLPNKPPASIALVLTERSSRESRWGVLRRAALLGLQLMLFERAFGQVSADLVTVLDSAGALLPSPLRNPLEYWNRVYELSNLPPKKKSETAATLGEVVKNRTDSMTFVWSAEEIWNQNQYKALQENTDLMIQFASPAWLEEWGSSRECEEFFKAITKFPQDAYYYLSESMRGSDLDGTILGAQERANLRWYELETKVRLERVLGSAGLLAARDGEFGTLEGVFSSPQLRRPLVRALFMPDFIIQGAERGQIWPYLGMLRDLLDSTNRILNDPNFRIAAYRGDAPMDKVGLLNEILNVLSK